MSFDDGQTALAWITRSDPFGGWSHWLELPQANDASVALLASLALFITPNGRGGRLLDWDSAVSIPWGILILFAAGIAPEVLMIPATLSASCAFMLPVATPPNAIVFGSHQVPIHSMMRRGLVLNIYGAILISLYCAWRLSG